MEEPTVEERINKAFREGVGRGVAAGMVFCIFLMWFLRWMFAAS